MGKIKIGDLPEDQTITKEEMRKVMGGTLAEFVELGNFDFQQQTGQITSGIPIGIRKILLEISRKMGG